MGSKNEVFEDFIFRAHFEKVDKFPTNILRIFSKKLFKVDPLKIFINYSIPPASPFSDFSNKHIIQAGFNAK